MKETRNKRTSVFQEIDGRPLTSAEALEMLQTNISYEEVKVRSAERARISRHAEKIEGTPLAEWPPFDVVWQLDPAQFYFVFDGAEPGSVGPDKLRLLNDVPIAKIDGASRHIGIVALMKFGRSVMRERRRASLCIGLKDAR